MDHRKRQLRDEIARLQERIAMKQMTRERQQQQTVLKPHQQHHANYHHHQQVASIPSRAAHRLHQHLPDNEIVAIEEKCARMQRALDEQSREIRLLQQQLARQNEQRLSSSLHSIEQQQIRSLVQKLVQQELASKEPPQQSVKEQQKQKQRQKELECQLSRAQQSSATTSQEQHLQREQLKQLEQRLSAVEQANASITAKEQQQQNFLQEDELERRLVTIQHNWEGSLSSHRQSIATELKTMGLRLDEACVILDDTFATHEEHAQKEWSRVQKAISAEMKSLLGERTSALEETTRELMGQLQRDMEQRVMAETKKGCSKAADELKATLSNEVRVWGETCRKDLEKARENRVSEIVREQLSKSSVDNDVRCNTMVKEQVGAIEKWTQQRLDQLQRELEQQKTAKATNSSKNDDDLMKQIHTNISNEVRSMMDNRLQEMETSWETRVAAMVLEQSSNNAHLDTLIEERVGSAEKGTVQRLQQLQHDLQQYVADEMTKVRSEDENVHKQPQANMSNEVHSRFDERLKEMEKSVETRLSLVIEQASKTIDTDSFDTLVEQRLGALKESIDDRLVKLQQEMEQFVKAETKKGSLIEANLQTLLHDAISKEVRVPLDKRLKEMEELLETRLAANLDQSIKKSSCSETHLVALIENKVEALENNIDKRIGKTQQERDATGKGHCNGNELQQQRESKLSGEIHSTVDKRLKQMEEWVDAKVTSDLAARSEKSTDSSHLDTSLETLRSKISDLEGCFHQSARERFRSAEDVQQQIRNLQGRMQRDLQDLRKHIDSVSGIPGATREKEERPQTPVKMRVPEKEDELEHSPPAIALSLRPTSNHSEVQFEAPLKASERPHSLLTHGSFNPGKCAADNTHFSGGISGSSSNQQHKPAQGSKPLSPKKSKEQQASLEEGTVLSSKESSAFCHDTTTGFELRSKFVSRALSSPLPIREPCEKKCPPTGSSSCSTLPNLADMNTSYVHSKDKTLSPKLTRSGNGSGLKPMKSPKHSPKRSKSPLKPSASSKNKSRPKTEKNPLKSQKTRPPLDSREVGGMHQLVADNSNKVRQEKEAIPSALTHPSKTLSTNRDEEEEIPKLQSEPAVDIGKTTNECSVVSPVDDSITSQGELVSESSNGRTCGTNISCDANEIANTKSSKSFPLEGIDEKRSNNHMAKVNCVVNQRVLPKETGWDSYSKKNPKFTVAGTTSRDAPQPDVNTKEISNAWSKFESKTLSPCKARVFADDPATVDPVDETDHAAESHRTICVSRTQVELTQSSEIGGPKEEGIVTLPQSGPEGESEIENTILGDKGVDDSSPTMNISSVGTETEPNTTKISDEKMAITRNILPETRAGIREDGDCSKNTSASSTAPDDESAPVDISTAVAKPDLTEVSSTGSTKEEYSDGKADTTVHLHGENTEPPKQGAQIEIVSANPENAKATVSAEKGLPLTHGNDLDDQHEEPSDEDGDDPSSSSASSSSTALSVDEDEDDKLVEVEKLAITDSDEVELRRRALALLGVGVEAEANGDCSSSGSEDASCSSSSETGSSFADDGLVSILRPPSKGKRTTGKTGSKDEPRTTVSFATNLTTTKEIPAWDVEEKINLFYDKEDIRKFRTEEEARKSRKKMKQAFQLKTAIDTLPSFWG